MHNIAARHLPFAAVTARTSRRCGSYKLNGWLSPSSSVDYHCQTVNRDIEAAEGRSWGWVFSEQFHCQKLCSGAAASSAAAVNLMGRSTRRSGSTTYPPAEFSYLWRAFYNTDTSIRGSSSACPRRDTTASGRTASSPPAASDPRVAALGELALATDCSVLPRPEAGIIRLMPLQPRSFRHQWERIPQARLSVAAGVRGKILDSRG